MLGWNICTQGCLGFFIWLTSVSSLRGIRDDALPCSALFHINRNWKSLFLLTKPANLKADSCKVLQVPPYSLELTFSNAWLVLLIWTTNNAFIGILCHLCAELIKQKQDWDKFLMILLNLLFNESWQCLTSFSADLLTSSKSDRLCSLEKLKTVAACILTNFSG